MDIDEFFIFFNIFVISHNERVPSSCPPITKPKGCSSVSLPNDVHSIEVNIFDIGICERSLKGSVADEL